METGEKRTLWLQSRPEEARRACRFCCAAIEPHFKADACSIIEVAIAEAFTNILKHSYRNAPNCQVGLTIAHEGEWLSFTFEENSAPFTPPAKPSTPELDDSRPEALPEGGWGNYLMHEAMDNLSYSREGEWNRLRMTRRIPDPGMETVGVSPNARSPAENRLWSQIIEQSDIIRDMTEELSSTYESLNLFYTFNHEINAQASHGDVLGKVLRRIAESAGASWGVLRLQEGHLFRLGSITGIPTIATPETVPIQGNAPECRVYNSSLERTCRAADGTPLLVLPLNGKDHFIGTLLFGGATPDAPGFLARNIKIAKALAEHAAVLLENYQIGEEILQARLDRQEMEIAHGLQQRLYPTSVPHVPGLNLFAEGVAARQVGGDYIALLPRDDGTLDFAIADAMGKGMPAAFFTILTHIAIRSVRHLLPDLTPGMTLTLLNQIMSPELERFDMFLTAIYGRINIGEKTLVWASAGHCPLILAEPGGAPHLLEPLDFMLGIAPGVVYRERTTVLLPGTRILAYTDGFTDIPDHHGQILGSGPLLKIFDQKRHLPLPQMCREILKETMQKTGPAGLYDDLALIGIELVKTEPSTTGVAPVGTSLA